MDNLDQFFKNKLQNRDFEFQEDYWDQARELIAEDDKRRRRGFWFRTFGWSLLLLTILAAGTGIYWWKSNNAPMASSASSIATKAANNTNTTILAEENLAKSSIKEELSPENKTQSSLKEPENPLQTQQSLQKSQSSSEDSKKPTSSFSTKDLQTKTTRKTPIDNNPSLKPGSSLAELPPSKMPDVPGKAKQPPSESENTPLATETNPKTIAEKQILSPAERIAMEANIQNLALLPILPLTAEKEAFSFSELRKYSPKRNRWNLGFTLTSQFHPVFTKESFWIGGAAGPTVGYTFGKNLSIQADLLYQIRRENFGKLDDAVTEKTYTFGLREKKNILQPTAIHSLELPIYLQWHNRRQSIEGGFFVSYLTALRGEWQEETFLLPWERNQGSPGNQNPVFTTETIKEGWITSDAFKSFNLGLLLGYRYRLTPALSANFRANYHLNSLLADPKSELIQDYSPLRFSVGITYFPFRNLRKK